ncbi:MAG TPA: hypothetical protein VMG12_34385 [Polyangiaceae bacterium]|nr:hypothetical protein [Polyangiaceae bacterium]
MNRFTSRALRVCAPLLGVLLVSGVASAKMVTKTWQVQGIHGSADEAKIHDALAKLPSVEHPLVNMTTVRLTYDDQKVTEPALRDTVAKAGSFQLMNEVPAAQKAAPKAAPTAHATTPATHAGHAH